jgi:hypothetical protein
LMQITTAIEVSWNDSDCGIETILLQEEQREQHNDTESYVWLHSFVNYSDWLRLGELSEFDVCSVWPIGGCLVLVLFLVCIEELESLKRIWRLIMTRSIPDSVEYGGRRMSKTKMVYDDISNVCVCVYAYYFTI